MVCSGQHHQFLLTSTSSHHHHTSGNQTQLLGSLLTTQQMLCCWSSSLVAYCALLTSCILCGVLLKTIEPHLSRLTRRWRTHCDTQSSAVSRSCPGSSMAITRPKWFLSSLSPSTWAKPTVWNLSQQSRFSNSLHDSALICHGQTWNQSRPTMHSASKPLEKKHAWHHMKHSYHMRPERQWHLWPHW